MIDLNSDRAAEDLLLPPYFTSKYFCSTYMIKKSKFFSFAKEDFLCMLVYIPYGSEGAVSLLLKMLQIDE